MAHAVIDELPGFRRRFRITPEPGCVRSELEDDYHCMRVTIRHADGVTTGIAGEVERAPWTSCPGAAAQLHSTFSGVPLADYIGRGEKRSNCTHLHDLATFAAMHADDAGPVVFDTLVSDPVEGRSDAELRRNGECVLRWTVEGNQLIAPQEIAGLTLDKLGPWISTLDAGGQEAARMLRWGTMMSHGRSMSLSEHRDASRMPIGNCFTFQPERLAAAHRTGLMKDFSQAGREPLQRRSAGS